MKIKKLDINLIKPAEELKKEYNKEKAHWIVELGFDYGLFGKRIRPDIGEASWNKEFPNGIDDWKMKYGNLYITVYGQQRIINKVNEIIDFLNKSKKI